MPNQEKTTPPTQENLETPQETKNSERSGVPTSLTTQTEFSFLETLPEQLRKERIQAVLRAAAELQKQVKALERTGEVVHAPEDPELEKLLASVQSDDLLLKFDLKLHAKDKEIFSVQGHNKMSRILTEEMLPEAPRNMEVIFYTSLFRPLMSAFAAHINEHVVNDNKVKTIALGTKSDVRSEIPAPNRQGYLSQEG